MKRQTVYIIAAIVASSAIIVFAIFASTSARPGGASTLLPAQTFVQTLQSTPGAVLVDVRTPSEFQASHIAGAINIDEEDPSFKSNIAQLDTSKTYFLYCHSGRRSALAAAAMHATGFTHLFELQGGISTAPQLLAATP